MITWIGSSKPRPEFELFSPQAPKYYLLPPEDPHPDTQTLTYTEHMPSDMHIPTHRQAPISRDTRSPGATSALVHTADVHLVHVCVG